MTTELAESTVRDLFEEIHEYPRLNLYVPHGFELEDVTVEERPNFFAPETLTEWSIAARLSVPSSTPRIPLASRFARLS
jgi:hypothetical protein